MSNAITEFIDGLPKAELHLHIEGTLEPEMVFTLAERNRVNLSYSSVEALRAAYDFKNLQDFLNLYYQATRVLLTERDFHDLASAYLARARAQNIRHAEIFFDPQAHTRRGVPLAAIVEGIGAALDEASRSNGPTTRLIACFLRDLDAADAMRTLDSLLPWRAYCRRRTRFGGSEQPAREIRRDFLASPQARIPGGGPRRRGGASGLRDGRFGQARRGTHRSRRAGDRGPGTRRAPRPRAGSTHRLPAL